MGHYPPGDVVPSLRRSHRMFHARHVFISGLRRTTSCWLRTPITFADTTGRSASRGRGAAPADGAPLPARVRPAIRQTPTLVPRAGIPMVVKARE